MQRMQSDPPAGVSASPVADNVMTWYGCLVLYLYLCLSFQLIRIHEGTP